MSRLRYEKIKNIFPTNKLAFLSREIATIVRSLIILIAFGPRMMSASFVNWLMDPLKQEL